mgnify:CR=1
MMYYCNFTRFFLIYVFGIWKRLALYQSYIRMYLELISDRPIKLSDFDIKEPLSLF